MFEAQAAKDARLEGIPLRLHPARFDAAHLGEWAVEADWPRGRVEVRYHFFSLHENAREHYVTDPIRALAYWSTTLLRVLRDGVLVRLYRTNWKNAFLQTYALLALPLDFAIGFAAGWFVPWPVADGWLLPTQILAGLAAGVAALWLAARVDRWFFVFFMVSGLRFGALDADGRIPTIAQHLAAYRAKVADELAAHAVDEIVVVGHSYSTGLAVELVADLLGEAPPDPARRPRLVLLTLGSNDWLVSYFRTARRRRAALAAVAARPDVTWIQYYSNWDFLCMGPADPIRAAGADLGGRAQFGPLIRRAHLAPMLSPANYRRSLFNFFRRHFQYLRGSDRAAEYSYLRLVCGPDPLA